MFDKLIQSLFEVRRKFFLPLRKQFPIVNRLDDPSQIRILCKSCSRSISARIVHLGFSDSIAFYNSENEAVLLIGPKLKLDDLLPPKRLPPGDFGIWEIPYWKKVENLFEKYQEGGTFNYLNPPRCPRCGGLILGNIFDGKPSKKVQEGYAILSGRICKVDDVLKVEEKARFS